MRIHLTFLALAAALTACQGNPAAPDATHAAGDVAYDGSPAIGTGLRDDTATTSSAFIGGGSREGDAALSSAFIGSGSRSGEDEAGDSPQTGGGAG